MKDKHIKNFLYQHNWEKIWKSPYSFLNTSIFATHYFKPCQKIIGASFSKIILIHEKGEVTLYRIKSENENFGKKLALRMEKDVNFVKKYCKKLKNLIEKIDYLYFKKDNLKEIISENFFKKFLADYEKVLPYYIGVYWASNYINPKAKQYKLLEETRKKVEPFYSNAEKFFMKYYKWISKRYNLTVEQASSLLLHEFLSILRGNNHFLPKRDELNQRYIFSILLFTKHSFRVLIGDDANKFEKYLTNLIESKEVIKRNKTIIQGVIAYPGKVRGKVQIISNPLQNKVFKEGNILVAVSTRPEFVPIIRKASAIVTDQGGLLSHAAIVSREMKKPCVIGTKIATKVLKDGDLVEVDANRGVVKIIKRSGKIN
jgi:phosphohistidine swiveling domain-containing protein